MAGWLIGEYQAVIFRHDGEDVGYALYKRELEWVHLRQFFVVRERRRRGFGQEAVQWPLANPWRDAARIRVKALVGNTGAVEFWHAMGFADYCLTMELER